jgi:hypothetical protein
LDSIHRTKSNHVYDQLDTFLSAEGKRSGATELTITEPVDATLNQANLTMAGREYRRKTNCPGSNEALEELTGREGRDIEFIAPLTHRPGRGHLVC